MTLDAELQAEHHVPYNLTLFNVMATHMTDSPPSRIIQQQREAKQCLACGDSSSH